jgi:hypothetical protein
MALLNGFNLERSHIRFQTSFVGRKSPRRQGRSPARIAFDKDVSGS